MKKYKFRDLTTFRIGGEIKYFFDVKNERELVKKVVFAKSKNLPIFVIGGGSDILVSDEKYNGVVIRYIGKNIEYQDNLVTAEAGASWDDLVASVVKKNLGGIESLSGIPGSVGAAPIQNIGAYGQELSDVFVSLDAYDIENQKFVKLNKSDCKFGYRDSLFKKRDYWQKYIITKVTLKLQKNKKPIVKYKSIIDSLPKNYSLKQVRELIIKTRNEKLDDWKSIPNAGSFFKNPTLSKKEITKLREKYPDIKCFDNKDGTSKCFAGWFIQNAGWLGKSYKNAKVSDKHALVLTNPKGRATSKEIVELAEKIQESVFIKFGVKLEPEVQYINF
ncbi:UDP-N-acetylmuramate dehydrogenase [Candidatus Microgenomates bacterium]|nr:UDP-N-acetylmuramate dehydrogenase [Candidatus Microgenomates bacterium]